MVWPLSNACFIRRTALSMIVAAVLAILATAPASADEPGAQIEIAASALGPVARVSVDGCPVALESEPAEHGLFLRYRNDCPQPLADKLALLGGLAGALVPQPGPEKLTLFVGRIVVTFPDIACEVAQTARARSAWDARRARKDSGYANSAFTTLLGAAPSVQLLSDTLAPWRLRLTRVSVEKVLADKPGRTPLANRIGGTAPVPFDALTYFIFEREAAANP
jgi:hypothetical protein